MPINIGNSSLREVYAGSTAIKEIYAGSNLVWSKGPAALILTLDMSNVQNLSDYFLIDHYLILTVNDEFIDVIDFESNIGFCLGDKFIYSNVSDGDVVELILASYGQYEFIRFEDNNGGETNRKAVTINGQTNVTLKVTDRYLCNSIAINYYAIQTAFGDIFNNYSDVTLTVEIEMWNVNDDCYDKKIYTYKAEDYANDSADIESGTWSGDGCIVFVNKDTVCVGDAMVPYSANWSIKYWQDGAGDGTGNFREDSGDITFKEPSDCWFEGYFVKN